ncbi:GAF domain-containing protein [Streptomyces sp. DSM 40750]|uniref:GAF domain-containing protein n=1 Tax=Streptomyces sp. DSM 40750 TaxID=2801030 RepID=UPI00214B6B12|nr:GAF domain-containing protein [Streptomyces sp. DSM 40750]UUU21966.1 GAF domain-containing protein [Streptomyces sp. DSM 40750]
MNAVALSETVLENARPEVAEWLAEYVVRHGGLVGSVHLSEPAEEGEIVLVAAYNLPPVVVNGAAVVVVGKGMAGVTAERRAPIGISDLQTDTSGVARPPARASQARGSVTLPVFAPDAPEKLVAVVGLGFAEHREFTDAEIAKLGADATTVLTVA